MTNPTADAAKLLPCPFCGGEAKLYRDESDYEQHRWWNVSCNNCEFAISDKFCDKASTKWNTRPQPAPPAGEPDYQEIAREIAGLCGKHYAPYPGFTPHPGYVADTVMQPLMLLLRDRLGLAARPKVEDGQLEFLGQRYSLALSQITELEAKLAEREAELAAVDTIIDNQWGTMTEIDKYKFQKITNAAIARHAARQQPKEDNK